MNALRSRLTLDRLALLIVLVGAVLLVASLVQGSDAGDARDHAAQLVPSNALLYVHARVDPAGKQWQRQHRRVNHFGGTSAIFPAKSLG